MGNFRILFIIPLVMGAVVFLIAYFGALERQQKRNSLLDETNDHNNTVVPEGISISE